MKWQQLFQRKKMIYHYFHWKFVLFDWIFFLLFTFATKSYFKYIHSLLSRDLIWWILFWRNEMWLHSSEFDINNDRRYMIVVMIDCDFPLKFFNWWMNHIQERKIPLISLNESHYSFKRNMIFLFLFKFSFNLDSILNWKKPSFLFFIYFTLDIFSHSKDIWYIRHKLLGKNFQFSVLIILDDKKKWKFLFIYRRNENIRLIFIHKWRNVMFSPHKMI